MNKTLLLKDTEGALWVIRPYSEHLLWLEPLEEYEGEAWEYGGTIKEMDFLNQIKEGIYKIVREMGEN